MSNSINTDNEILESVSEYYGKTLQHTSDLKTNACCIDKPTQYSKKEIDALTLIHPEILSKFYGCGSPVPVEIEGAVLLDLGCGTGRDCYLASALVGQKGHVIGIDMLDEQLDVAKKYIDYHTKAFNYTSSNVEFKKGQIENLRNIVEDNSIDCVISNCVVNLSPDKQKVFEEIMRILKPNGQLYFSDVYSDRRIPEHLKKDKVLWGECLSGALYIEDFRRMIEKVGFNYYYTVSSNPITVNNPEIIKQLGDIKFISATIRAFKIPEMEDRCEDYGDEVTYLGTIPGREEELMFDRAHTFKTNVKYRVCRNMSLVLSKCDLYMKHFKVEFGKTHLGLFGKESGVCSC
jgi:arsenite methyltransferase